MAAANLGGVGAGLEEEGGGLGEGEVAARV